MKTVENNSINNRCASRLSFGQASNFPDWVILYLPDVYCLLARLIGPSWAEMREMDAAEKIALIGIVHWVFILATNPPQSLPGRVLVLVVDRVQPLQHRQQTRDRCRRSSRRPQR